jgi:hypothetical protein
MAALTAARPNSSRASQGALSQDLNLQMAASTTIYQGALVVLNTSGLAKPATGVTGEQVAGVAQETKTSGATGATFIRVRRGTYKFANLGADAITQARVLLDCYADDDQTVRATSATGTRSRAGRVIEIESDGVWVETY